MIQEAETRMTKGKLEFSCINVNNRLEYRIIDKEEEREIGKLELNADQFYIFTPCVKHLSCRDLICITEKLNELNVS